MWVESTHGMTTTWRWRKTRRHLFSRATVTHHPLQGYRWMGGIDRGEAASLAEAQRIALDHKDAYAKSIAAAKGRGHRVPALEELL